MIRPTFPPPRPASSAGPEDFTVANPNLFRTQNQADPGALAGLPAADTVNPAGGVAFEYGPRHRLAQLMMTGTGFDSFYQGGGAQLAAAIEASRQVDDADFLARAVVAGATAGYMKDLPLVGLVLLSRADKKGDLFRRAFDLVVRDGRRLRTLFQMIRAKNLGRTSLSYRLKRAFARWVTRASASKLINASIGGKGADGKDASLGDVLACCHPRPTTSARRALYGWLRKQSPSRWSRGGGKTASLSDLPEEARLVRAFDSAATADEQVGILRVMRENRSYIRWDRLAGSARGDAVWKEFARGMAPQALRMNLNSLAEHGVFSDPELTELVVSRLTDAGEIRGGRQWPFQYYAAYKHLKDSVPSPVKAALHTAAELCCGNVPRFPGPLAVCVDVSSSMECPVTGVQGAGKTSKVRCVDAAAVFASALVRANPDSVLVPFNDRPVLPERGSAFDPGDSMLSLARQLADLCRGGTNCHAALEAVNARYGDRAFSGVVYLSDNASWVDRGRPLGYFPYDITTALLAEWRRFRENQARLGRFPAPRMICWDLAHYGSTQAPESEGIYNVGGFSDAVFGLISSIIEDDRMRFVRLVEATSL